MVVMLFVFILIFGVFIKLKLIKNFGKISGLIIGILVVIIVVVVVVGIVFVFFFDL